MKKCSPRTSFFACALLLFLSSLVYAGGKKFQAVYDGETVKSVSVRMIGGDTYISLRDVAGIYGARLAWRPVTGKVSLQMNNRQLDVYLKSTRVRIGAKKARLSLPSKLVKNDGYIPFDFVLSSAFADFSETTSSWNSETDILTVAPRVTVVASRFYSRPAGTQIIIELLDDISGDVSEQKTGQLVVTVPRGRVKEETIHVGDSSISDMTLKNDGRQAVITIGLLSPARLVDKKVLDNPRRLVLDVSVSTLTVASATVIADTGTIVLSSGTAPALTPVAAVPVAAVVPAISAKVRRTIILDAGHGGEDPGAIGPNGTKEKDINLAIVFELKRLFEEDGGYQVILSRTDDTFIPLVERTSLANDKKADLFVSVHCNANFDRNASGFEIYFLNENASDPDAAATAMLENSVVKLEGKPTKKRARVQSLLWSLAINEFINESSELCSFIAGEATKHTKVANRGVKQAGFFVLKGAQMPAVLVECSFLSNYAEEAKLKTRKFQAGMADSIYEGVKRYEERRAKLVRVYAESQERS
ncbi:MAG: N-acetylmuramoyl-L-alanine amidase [Elusimicrobia bacterium]|nr:N-acetylmuramoyl-L-alanine amidase [Elusimicrobiota bacterium]